MACSPECKRHARQLFRTGLDLDFSMSQHERLFTHWLSGRPVWLAMFALTLLSTAYAIVVALYPGAGLVWSPGKPAVVFIGWGAIQTCFVVVCLMKLRHERYLRRALVESLSTENEGDETSRDDAAAEIRYHDYFENLTEMIAMLSAEGKYLYVNTAWQRYFSRDAAAARALDGFASAFPFAIQSQAATIFERALAGEHIEQVHLRMEDSAGRTREMEAS